MPSYNEISVSTLARLLGTPECPELLDVRIDEDFDDDPRLIPGAYRHSFLDVASFDIEGVFWSHRGDNCTFDTMIEEFGIENNALACLARIVRGADTNRHDLAPEVAGLLAVSLGLSRMYRDDLAQLEAGLTIYDAFYRWARDATGEGHDWTVASARA